MSRTPSNPWPNGSRRSGTRGKSSRKSKNCQDIPEKRKFIGVPQSPGFGPGLGAPVLVHSSRQGKSDHPVHKNEAPAQKGYPAPEESKELQGRHDHLSAKHGNANQEESPLCGTRTINHAEPSIPPYRQIPFDSGHRGHVAVSLWHEAKKCGLNSPGLRKESKNYQERYS